MPNPLQVLIVEDRAADAELIVKELVRAGFDPDWQRVDNAKDAKARFTPRLDLVLSDYNLPGYGAIPALADLRASGLDIPFIVVSGSIGDEKAAECLKLGATDYILKDRMARLGPAVRRALADHGMRIAKARTEDSLRRSEEQMRSILATVQDVVFSVSLPEFKVRYMNPAAEILFGTPIETLLAGPNSWLDGVHLEDRARMAEEQEKTLRWGTNETRFRVVRPGGEVRHVVSRVWCAYAPDGTPLAFEGIMSDITDKVKAEEERVELKHSHEEADRLRGLSEFKSQFLNMVAHDLNNVLTPLRLNLAMVDNELAKAGARSVHLPKLHSGVDRLVNFLADLLDAARLQSGRLALNRTAVDLSARLRVLADSLAAQATGQGVRLAVDAPTSTQLEGDPHRLDQLMANLLSNALKFTPSGGTVTASVVAAGPEVHLAVRDTGIGIARDDLAKLFQPFSRLGNVPQGKHTGTGLGLFICRGIVEQHGGRIWCESEGVGKGSVFQVRLPVEPQSPGPAQG